MTCSRARFCSSTSASDQSVHAEGDSMRTTCQPTTCKSWWNARRTGLRRAVLVGAGTLLGCGANPLSAGEDGFSAEEWDRVLELEPLSVPVPPSPFNEYADDPA